MGLGPEVQTQGTVCRPRSGVHSYPGASRSAGRRFLQVLWAGGGRWAASAESAGAEATLPTGVTPIPVSAAGRVGWAR